MECVRHGQESIDYVTAPVLRREHRVWGKHGSSRHIVEHEYEIYEGRRNVADIYGWTPSLGSMIF